MPPLLPESPVIILGAGISGRGAARLLEQRGRECVFFDEGGGEPGFISAPGDIQADRFDAAVLSPGFAGDHPAIAVLREAGVPLYSEVETAIAACETPYLGVTGSNGKTTTTTLLSHVLQSLGEEAPAVGNIGDSFCDAVLRHPRATRFVVEFSSYQLERFQPARAAAVALLLNLSPDHLERHGSLEAYLDAKLNLARHAESLVYNADDPAFADLPARLPGMHCITFGIDNPRADVRLQEDTIHAGCELSTRNYQLRGRHNLQNAMAVLAACRFLGCDLERANRAIAGFAPLPHRLEPVAEVDGVVYINDSKATNADAVNYALQTFADSSVHLLAGGIIKADDLSDLRAQFERSVIQLYLYGRDRERIQRGLGNPANVSQHETLAEAFAAAAVVAQRDETVLLSPLCASFDQYNNFEERGEHFRELVAQLAAAKVARDE